MNLNLIAPAVTVGVMVLAVACAESDSAQATGRAGAPEPPAAAAPSARPAPPVAPKHLRTDGTGFVRPDGTPLQWRGMTAFRLLEMIAQGRAPEAERFLDWCSSNEVTVVRVLTMATHLFDLRPEDGVVALPRLLEMAEARGLYVEIVALADTAAMRVDIDRHVREVGAIAARHGNALVELANEPRHPTQSRRIHDPSELATIARLVPEIVPVALGSAEDDERFAAGDYATFHFPRADGDNGWRHVAALAKGGDLLRRWRKPLVNDEPIGADDAFEPGRRDDNPERFRAAAALSRMTGMGATFHYEGGLHARVPEGRERECFNAWQEAWTLLPDGGAPTLMQPGDAGSPVQSVKGDLTGAYVAVRGERAWLLAIGTRGDLAVTWADGWRPGTKQAWNESAWWSAARAK